jgi:carbonic anhydrase
MLDDLRAKNRAWAQRKTELDPEFFKRLASQQSPQYLWIGCSDSRVPATEIVDLDPGEMFVHRNIANLAPPQDANYLSVLQYAVEVLKVHYVLVVGHYGCGGVRAALEGTDHGLIDHWLTPIRDVAQECSHQLEGLATDDRLNRLVELNVVRQVRNVASNPFVTQAWRRGQKLAIHGWVYSLENGLITDLKVRIANITDYNNVFRRIVPDGVAPPLAQTK